MVSFVRAILLNRKSLIFIYLVLLAYAISVVVQQRQSVFPDASFPKATFSVDNGFAPLSEMEIIYGKPIESLVGASVGVLSYTSKIERGYAKINVSLDSKRDFKADFEILKSKIATLVQAAPTPSGAPATFTATLTNSNNLALLGYSLVSPVAGQLDLRNIVDRRIVPALQQVQGVGQIEVIGGSLPEVRIVLRPRKLEQYRLTPNMVASQIKDQAGTRFLGTFTSYGKLILGFNDSALSSTDAISALPVRSGINTLRLSDIADVYMATSYTGVLTSTDHNPSVLFNVYGAPGVDVVSLSAQVSTVISKLQASLPPTMKISRWYSLANFITTSLGSVTKSIWIGLIIVSASVLLFLRDWRAAVPVVACMIVTVMLTFIAMDAMGETLNIMTLAGISAAVGLVVDDATVVVENIARHNEMGYDSETAVVKATAEVLSPDTSGTLTTVAVFAPLTLLTGITGFLFKASAFVIMASLLISLITALTLAPALAYWLMKPSKKPRPAGENSMFKYWYQRFLQASLKAPMLVVITAAVVVSFSFYVGRSLPTAYLPQWDEGTFIMDMDTAAGTSRDEMARQVAEVEQVIASMPEIQTYSRQIGDTALQSNQAHFFMHPKPASAGGGRSVFQVMADLENTLLTKFPNLNIDLHQILPDHFDGLSGKNNVISIDVFGPDMKGLISAGDTIVAAIGKLPGVAKVKVKPPESVTQFSLVLNPDRMVLHNLTRSEVIEQVRAALDGNSIGFLSTSVKRVAIRMVYPDRWRQLSSSLTDMPIFASDGTATPLSGIAQINLTQAPDRMTRKQGHLYQSIAVTTTSADLGGNANRIVAKLSQLSLPSGAYAIVSGDWKRQVQAFTQLRTLFLMSLGLVFTLLLLFFRKYGYSLVIILNTLTSLSFVIFGIWYFGTAFNVPTFMGMISVVGIVVNNGILVMAFLSSNLNKGENPVQAIIDASLVRARPIMMTSTAAILGFLPMALSTGRGGEMMQPFAAAIIYGVAGGALSSLVLLPSMYVLGVRLFRFGPSRT